MPNPNQDGTIPVCKIPRKCLKNLNEPKNEHYMTVTATTTTVEGSVLTYLQINSVRLSKNILQLLICYFFCRQYLYLPHIIFFSCKMLSCFNFNINVNICVCMRRFIVFDYLMRLNRLIFLKKYNFTKELANGLIKYFSEN